MKKKGIVFSSSEYSDSEMIKVIPQAKNPNNKANLQSDSGSYYYVDYSDSSDGKVTVNKTKPQLRTQISRNIGKPSQTNKPEINSHDQNQNLNQNKREINQTQKNTLRNPRGLNRPIRPLPRPIRTSQVQTQQRKQSPTQQPTNQEKTDIKSSKSSPTINNLKKSDSDSEYYENSSDDQPKSYPSQDDTNTDINTKIHSSPRETKTRQPQFNNNNNNNINDDDDNDAVIQTPIENDDFTPPPTNIPSNPTKKIIEEHTTQKITDSISYSVNRTTKRSVHGKSYIFTLIKEGNPVLYSKSNTRHPKGILPISTNPDIHIRKSSSSEYTITAENGCTKFTIKSPQNTILTYNISPSQNEFVKLPHLNISVDESFDFVPKEMTSKRPQMSKRGFWFLDFHNKFTLPSEKNAIFIPTNPEVGKNDLFVVRKIEKNRIEIDANIETSDIIVFAIGLASFLAKFC